MGLQGLSTRDIIGKFYLELESNLGSSYIPQISMLFNSDQETENYKWLGFTPALREWIGGRNAKGLRENGITIENKKFESTLEIAVDDLRRDKTGQIDIRIGELADRVNEHWAKLLSTLIINGESQACYDGQYFFDTDHSEGDSGTQTNKLAAGDYGELNVATPTNPTAYELSLVILKMIQHLYGIKDDQGEPMNSNALKFLVMVPVQFWGNAQQAVTSGLLNSGSGSIENPLRNTKVTIDVVANPRLTWTNKLTLLRTDGRAKPFIRQEEEGIKMTAIAEGSEEEFLNDRHLYGVKTIRNVGMGYWQHAVLATLS
jgi:phage major head subunit gpT-like protein